mgnify:CR=1 FL=1
MADEWTRAMVADRLELAAEVMKSLPPVRPQGYFNAWPDYAFSFGDQVGQEPRLKKPLPSPRMITEADEAMLCLRWLDKDVAQILLIVFQPVCASTGVVVHQIYMTRCLRYLTYSVVAERRRAPLGTAATPDTGTSSRRPRRTYLYSL